MLVILHVAEVAIYSVAVLVLGFAVFTPHGYTVLICGCHNRRLGSHVDNCKMYCTWALSTVPPVIPLVLVYTGLQFKFQDFFRALMTAAILDDDEHYIGADLAMDAAAALLGYR